MTDIYYKLKDFVLINIYGLTVGFLLGCAVYAYVNFAAAFKLLSAGLLIVLLIANLVTMKTFSGMFVWAGAVLRTLVAHFVLAGAAGLVWLYVAEEYETGFYADLATTILVPLIILGADLFFIIKYIWPESAAARSLEEHAGTLKFLLRFKSR